LLVGAFIVSRTASAWFYVPIRPFFDFAPGRSRQAAFFSAKTNRISICFCLGGDRSVILIIRLSRLPEAIFKKPRDFQQMFVFRRQFFTPFYRTEIGFAAVFRRETRTKPI
jgi:hypothetical protein